MYYLSYFLDHTQPATYSNCVMYHWWIEGDHIYSKYQWRDDLEVIRVLHHDLEDNNGVVSIGFYNDDEVATTFSYLKFDGTITQFIRLEDDSITFICHRYNRRVCSVYSVNAMNQYFIDEIGKVYEFDVIRTEVDLVSTFNPGVNLIKCNRRVRNAVLGKKGDTIFE